MKKKSITETKIRQKNKYLSIDIKYLKMRKKKLKFQ